MKVYNVIFYFANVTKIEVLLTMNIPKKQSHHRKSKVFKILLYGVFVSITSVVLLTYFLLSWNILSKFIVIPAIVFFIWLFWIGISLLIMLFRGTEKIGRKSLEMAFHLFKAINKIRYWYNFFFVLYVIIIILLLVVPYFIWSLLQTLIVALHSFQQLFWYIWLTIVCWLLTYRIEKIAKLFINLFQFKDDYSKKYSALKRPLVRFFIYGTMAISYVGANVISLVQSASEVTSTNVFKQVVLEVFLTYVAIDSVLVAWDDYREETNKFMS